MSEHGIETGDSKPIFQYPFYISWKAREVIQKQVKEMEARGIIEKSHSPWASPVVLVKKPDGTWRFCVDYRKLNAVTTRDVYPPPLIESALTRLQGSTVFTSLDLESGFWQMPLREVDRPKSAFITPDGLR